MSVNKLTKYDVFLATIKRWRAVDNLMWKNIKFTEDPVVFSDIQQAQRENKESEIILNIRFGL